MSSRWIPLIWEIYGKAETRRVIYTRIWVFSDPYKYIIKNSDLKQEHTDQKKNAFWHILCSASLHKTYESTSFHWPVFSRKGGRIRVSEKPAFWHILRSDYSQIHIYWIDLDLMKTNVILGRCKFSCTENKWKPTSFPGHKVCASK